MAVKVRDMIIASVATKSVFKRFAALSDEEKEEVVSRVKKKMNDGGSTDSETDTNVGESSKDETVLDSNNETKTLGDQNAEPEPEPEPETEEDDTLDVIDDEDALVDEISSLLGGDGDGDAVDGDFDGVEDGFHTSHAEDAADLIQQAQNGEVEDDPDEVETVEEPGMSIEDEDGKMMSIVDGLTKEIEQIKSDGKVEKSEVMGLFDNMMQMVTLLVNTRAPAKPRKKSAKVWDTEEAKEKYLSEHKNADPANHKVRSNGSPKGKKEEDKKIKKKKNEDDPSGKKPSGDSDEKKPSVRERIKDLGSKIKESVENAPAEVKKLTTDENYRNEKLTAIADGIKAAPGKIGKSIAESAKAEVKEIKHGGKAIGKLVKGEKLNKEDKHAIYAVGVYAAGTALAAATGGGAAGAAIALAHSFKLHVAIKAVHTMADEGFLGFEAFHTISHALDAISHVAAEDGGDEERNQEVLVNWITAAVVRVLEEGIPQDEMDDIMNGVDYEDGLRAIEHLKFNNAGTDIKEARVSFRIASGMAG